MYKIFVILKALLPSISVGIVAYYSDWSLGEWVSTFRKIPLSKTDIRAIDLSAASTVCTFSLLLIEYLGPIILTYIQKLFLKIELNFQDDNNNPIDRVYVYEPGSETVPKIKIKITLIRSKGLSWLHRIILRHTKIKIEWPQKWLEVEPDLLDDLQHELEDGIMRVTLTDLISYRGGQAIIILTMQTKHISTKVEYLDVDLECEIFNYDFVKPFLRKSLFTCKSAKCELQLVS